MKNRNKIDSIFKQYRNYIPSLFGEVNAYYYNECEDSIVKEDTDTDITNDIGLAYNKIYNLYPSNKSYCHFTWIKDNCFVLKRFFQKDDKVKNGDLLAITITPYDKNIQRQLEAYRQILIKIAQLKAQREEIEKEPIWFAPSSNFEKYLSFVKQFSPNLLKSLTTPGERAKLEHDAKLAVCSHELGEMLLKKDRQRTQLINIWKKEKDNLMRYVA